MARGHNHRTVAATSLQTLVQLVENGYGVSLLPRIALEAGLLSGDRVVVRPLGSEPLYRTIGLAWRPRSPREKNFGAIAAVLEDPLSR